MTSAEGTARHRITVLGTGYLGTAHAACLAELGFEVLGVDTDPSASARSAGASCRSTNRGWSRCCRRG